MTILDAIKTVLKDYPDGKTSSEITKEIIEKGLYQFKAAQPVSVVNSQIRRHCEGLDFPSAYPIKCFCITPGVAGKTKYQLLDYEKTRTDPLPAQSLQKDLIPEEKLLKNYQEHLDNISTQLLETVLDKDPKFFEELVVELLIKLGYGYSSEAGLVVGKSHDGGVDGIINEDKLGLDKIYIQAKRYSPKHKVTAEELDGFIGAMARRNANKGVFITTSSFTAPAIAAAKDSKINISLVDGQLLCGLMVSNCVGVRAVKTLSIYEIDMGFFS